jgi:hydrogenase/urease accessory protein HupE
VLTGPGRQRRLRGGLGRHAALLTLTLAALAGAAHPISAHSTPFTYLDLNLHDRTIDVSLVAHVIDVSHDIGLDTPEGLLDPAVLSAHRAAIVALFEPRLVLRVSGRDLHVDWQSVDPAPDRQGIRLHGRVTLDGQPGVVTIRCLLFPYDPTHQTFLNIYEHGRLTHQGILDRDHTTFDYYPGTRQGTLAVIARFVPAGIHHIAIGPDHILFLVGLLLLGGSIRQLLVIVTAFTLAHSLTLSLAALNLVHPPAAVIEPAIALSIVFVGLDNLLIRGGRDLRPFIAFGFGLVHGFGFASVLREVGLPARALGWSLFSFNLGVEIGQAMIVVVVATLLAVVRRRSETLARRVTVAGSLVVVGAGAFWFVQRVFFP